MTRLTLALFGSVALAPLAEASSRVVAVTVHPDGAVVRREIVQEVVAGSQTLTIPDLPATARPDSFRVVGAEGVEAVVVGVEVAPKAAAQPRLSPEQRARREALVAEQQGAEDRIAAHQIRKRVVIAAAEAMTRHARTPPDGNPPPQFFQNFERVAEEISAADRAIRVAERERAGIDARIAEIDETLRARPSGRAEARVQLEAASAGRLALTLAYEVREARWSPHYDARLVTTGAEPKVQLVRRAALTQTTGEDWDGVTLVLTTQSMVSVGALRPVQPWIVQVIDPRAPRQPAPVVAPLAGSVQQQRMADAAPGAGREAIEAQTEAATTAITAEFRVPGHATITSGAGGRLVRLSSFEVRAAVVTRFSPSQGTHGVIEARLRIPEDAPMLPGPMALFRDGTSAGTVQFAGGIGQAEATLAFGVDDRVRLEITPARRDETVGTLFSGGRVETRQFRFVVRAADQPRRIVVEDRLPVSESAEVIAEFLPTATPPTAIDVEGRRGVVRWSFDLPAGGTREILHGWRIRYPGDKTLLLPDGRS